MEIMQCLENVEKLGGFGREVGFCERGRQKEKELPLGVPLGLIRS